MTPYRKKHCILRCQIGKEVSAHSLMKTNVIHKIPFQISNIFDVKMDLRMLALSRYSFSIGFHEDSKKNEK